MSLGAQIAGIAGKVTGSVGGGPVLAVLVAAGLVTGGLVGGFAGQPKPEGTSTSVLDIYPCWKAGPAFAKGPPGQKVWVTGKNSDASPLLRRAQDARPREDVARYLEQVERMARAQR